MRIHEWAKFIYNVAKEKINVFYKGFVGGSLVSGTLLFGGSVHNSTFISLIFAYLIKVIAVLVAGFISGFATVLGNDIYLWVKGKVKKK